MKTHHIDLSTLQPSGAISMDLSGEFLRFTTTRRLSNDFETEGLPLNASLNLPSVYRLPFRIDLRLTLDAPTFIVCIGDGHVSFATPWSDNRHLGDLIRPDRKPRAFYNHVPLHELVDMQITFDLHAMQIKVNGEVRFHSITERYMRAKTLTERNLAGFPIRLACAKHTNVTIHQLTVTEYEAPIGLSQGNQPLPAPIEGNPAIVNGQKPTVEVCLSLLPEDIRQRVLDMDHFLRTLRPMKFKRQVEKNGNKITWFAPEQGFSYAVHPTGDIMTHALSWYIITSGKPETWHRKADHMEEALQRTAEDDPDLAKRLFDNLSECIGCRRHCMVKTAYTFNGQTKVTCHGLMAFTQSLSDLEDARAFILQINNLALTWNNG